MWDVEAQCFDMGAEPVQGRQLGRLGEGARPEGDLQVIEQRWRSPSAEVMAGKSQACQIGLRDERQEGMAALVVQPESEKGAAVAKDEAADGGVAVGGCWVGLSDSSSGLNAREGRVHLSLWVSISPKRSLLHPVLELAADVAEAADEMLANEAARDGLFARTDLGRSCLVHILQDWKH
ncbi:hypothetical protein Tdes44962_MAKER08738 [Teratosphaeria destructans]|uniref:Uncharacterized protein n=1 Tax=Teratosphaeria destructans TaxID=418781 RepID=A0A9W7SVB9_9PEZI|nr:hypothetical protein Tdes44962_MAKER08738 [Teratosphaeria destructans]